jgi:hypothetical protein
MEEGQRVSHVKIIDLSLAGCRILCKQLLNPSAHVRLTFFLKTGDGHEEGLPISARVTRVFRTEEEEKMVGLAFIGSIFPENGIEQLISEAKKNPKSPGF